MLEPENDGTDNELDPTKEPKSSRAWLAMLKQAERAFEDYQSKADRIDELYANLNKLSRIDRDRQFQLFWANIQVLGPSIYSRPPVPVVVPRFKDRRPLYRVASELLERALVVALERGDMNGLMMLIRDDLNIVGRGSPAVRYESKAESDGPTERICFDFKDRKDFLHEPARNWREVGWVANASYLTKKEMRKRFRKTSGDAYQDAVYNVQREDKDNGAGDNRMKAKVWEVWSRTENKVVWVCEGVQKLLDEDEPHLKLEGFFPCPKPAYATVQRRSLVPVPDMIYYKDQLEEINELTNRIHALSEAIKVRGFYPGGAEIGDAIEAAINIQDDRKVMVPIANWAAFGGTGEQIIWLPIDVIGSTVAQLVELRKAVIDDVYQIMGLSDIMRGTSEASETLGAQQLKSQYGSVRIRDKQGELVRVARDMVAIAAEIMAENFSQETLLEMSQMEIPSEADIRKQVKPLEDQAKAINKQIQEAQNDPEVQAMIQQDPEKAQQVMQQAQQQVQGIMEQIEKLQAQPTIEDVMKFLRDQKTRPFVLDIETDSTIQPDEQAEKQARTEFVQALGGAIQQFAPVLQMMPALTPVVGDIIKFAIAPFRAGRELEGKIDEAVDQMAAQASQPQPNPEQEQLKAEQAMEQIKLQMEQQRQQAEDARKDKEIQAKMQMEAAKIDAEREGQVFEAQIKHQESQQKMALEQQKGEREERKFQLEIQKLQMEIEAQQAQFALKAQSAQVDAEIKTRQAEQQAIQSDRAFEQQSALNAQKAEQAQMGAAE
ncbi:hypothetical protein NL154_05655 [Rhizobium sp. YTUHZ044]|uniref:hypothetical protein n=1 Tax=Rhizobium sp. YTUHZ044 TaxID=2962678 RepID=UPI003DA8F33C